MSRMPNPRQVTIHDEVTQTIITGILSRHFSDTMSPTKFCEAAEEIMKTIKRRGYEPQIRSFNQLKNGTYV